MKVASKTWIERIRPILIIEPDKAEAFSFILPMFNALLNRVDEGILLFAAGGIAE